MQFPGKLCNDRIDLAHYSAVFFVNGIRPGNVGLGNHQEVNRRLRIYVVKSQNVIVFIELFAGNLPGDDPAE